MTGRLEDNLDGKPESYETLLEELLGRKPTITDRTSIVKLAVSVSNPTPNASPTTTLDEVISIIGAEFPEISAEHIQWAITQYAQNEINNRPLLTIPFRGRNFPITKKRALIISGVIGAAGTTGLTVYYGLEWRSEERRV